MPLIADLKQRKLVQWALAYAAAAFALVQGVDIVAAKFGWPDSVERMLIIAAFIGFLVTLLLAWYHGERGAQKVSGTELLLLSLLLAIGGGLLWKFARNSPVTPPSSAVVENADRRSIAVLPFVNMSGDKDNEYFSDGISEEILNVLAKTPDLHVAARTSSFAFKGKSTEVPAIALELNVRMVLEGSVRKQGNRVRITAQLIDAKTGFHVWSQTYDRNLQDIFAIQDEIAKAIGDELEVKLAGTPAAGKNSTGTSNLKAYDLYLRGIALWQTRRDKELWQAIDLFDQATRADPKFAQGYAGQALAYAVIGDYSARIPYTESLARATDFSELALELDPSLPESYAALGLIAIRELRRATADGLLSRAILLRPSYATAYQWRGTQLMSNGDLAGGLASLERASALDPRSPKIADNHAWALLALGRNADAKALCTHVLETAPTFAGCLERVGIADLLSGDFDGARSMLERLAAATNPSASGQAQQLVEALAGRADRHAFARRLAALPFKSNLDPASGNALADYEIPVVLMLLGERELALDYLERLDQEVGGYADWVVMLPVMDPIRCEPRFVAVIKKLKTTDPYYTKVCAGKH